jgi:hypothetical protein
MNMEATTTPPPPPTESDLAQQRERERQSLHRALTDHRRKQRQAVWLLVLVGVPLLVGAVYGIREGLVSLGWISHDEDALITADANWLVGESKGCISVPINTVPATPEDKYLTDLYGRLLDKLQSLSEDTRSAKLAAMQPEVKAYLYSSIQTRLHSQLRTTNSATTYLKCDDGPEHSIKIEFYGRIDHPAGKAACGGSSDYR